MKFETIANKRPLTMGDIVILPTNPTSPRMLCKKEDGLVRYFLINLNTGEQTTKEYRSVSELANDLPIIEYIPNDELLLKRI